MRVARAPFIESGHCDPQRRRQAGRVDRGAQSMKRSRQLPKIARGADREPEGRSCRRFNPGQRAG